MPKKKFLLTYSVSPINKTEASEAEAQIIRRNIRNLEKRDDWNRISNIETAFDGELYVYGSDIQEKRNDAEEKIETILKGVFEEPNVPKDALNRMYVYVVLFVDGLDGSIEFMF